MATGLDLVRMPGFAFPENAKLDFTPLRQALQHRTEVGLRQSQEERERERLGIERQRFGLEERRFAQQTAQAAADAELRRRGLELQARGVGVQEGQFGLAQTERQRQEEERRRIRIANEAWRISQERDPARRTQRFRSMLETSPTMASEVARLGFRLGDGGGDIDVSPILDRLIAQVPDSQERYRPTPLTAVPAGQTLGRVTPEGGFEPVFAGPRPGARNVRTSMANALSGLQDMSRLAQQILANPNLSRVTGTVIPYSSVPGSEARDLRALVERLQSTTGLRQLQALREASGSSSGLGQLTEREMAQLQQAIANLDLGQSPAALRAQLREVVRYAQEAQGRMVAGYTEQFGPWVPPGGSQGAPSPGGQQPPGAGAQAQPGGNAPAEGTRRQLNGRSYVFRGGQWFQE